MGFARDLSHLRHVGPRPLVAPPRAGRVPGAEQPAVARVPYRKGVVAEQVVRAIPPPAGPGPEESGRRPPSRGVSVPGTPSAPRSSSRASAARIRPASRSKRSAASARSFPAAEAERRRHPRATVPSVHRAPSSPWPPSAASMASSPSPDCAWMAPSRRWSPQIAFMKRWYRSGWIHRRDALRKLGSSGPGGAHGLRAPVGTRPPARHGTCCRRSAARCLAPHGGRRPAPGGAAVQVGR